jgi:hypothetical protein
MARLFHAVIAHYVVLGNARRHLEDLLVVALRAAANVTIYVSFRLSILNSVSIK